MAGQGASPLCASHALEHVGDELPTTVNTEAAIESGHVLVRRGVADAEPRGDLLLAVALEQARECLAQARGERLGTRLGRADQRPADRGPSSA